MRRQNLAGVAPLGVLGEPPALTVAEVKACQAEGAVVLDTRVPEAFGAGHVPGALNVGLGPMFATWAGSVFVEGATFITGAELPKRTGEVPEDKPLAVTCGRGYRSSVASSLLAGQAKTPVLNVLGGMTARKHAGYEMVR